MADETTSLTIEITKGREQAFSLALVPFVIGEGVETKENIYNIVSKNIDISGQLRRFPIALMPSLPVNSNQINYQDWQQSDAEFILLAQVNKDASSRYRIEYSLHDVFGTQILRSETLFFNDASLRDTAHFLSDIVYEEITGLKGIFSTKLAYITIDGPRSKRPIFRLQISDIDGLRPQVLLVSKTPIISPNWSPDGNNIAYVSFERGASNVFVQNLVSGNRRLVSSFRGINGSPDWSPNGRFIALVLSRNDNTDIYILELSTGKLKRVTSDPRIDTEPSWSGDGRRLLFTSERNGTPHIFEVDLDTEIITQITRTGKYNTRPRYAENGRAFVYIKQIEKKFRLVKQRFTDDEIVVLGKYNGDESPSVAPNGNAVIYSTTIDNKSTLVVTSADGEVEYRLPTNANEVIEPAWSKYRI